MLFNQKKEFNQKNGKEDGKMKIRMSRYYGDGSVTKSVMRIESERGGFEPMECEAREMAFKVYTEKFRGSSGYCVPEGTYTMQPRCTEFGVMTLRTKDMRGHANVSIGWSWTRQTKHDTILVGWSDGSQAAEVRRITGSRECFDELTKRVYAAWADGEEFTLEIVNEDPLCPDGHLPHNGETMRNV
ncbi:MAG: hypothetical protein IJP75_10140 [Bacteroidaceae bacterium]|nr:hypothetical protein [Bacteroidaceae bacterium]